ncbi:toxin HicA [Actinoplanes sp. NPDC051851]|uniref:toxin HicA n=1 Tax=Actinoplanes sp. NPDC051851 TaxID=3154753 RepID=UPI003414B276
MADRLAKILAEMRRNPNNVRFADLLFGFRHYFGEPRSQGTSHYVFKMPWPGDPRVNIQDKGGKAKPYQVKQVLTAIEKLGERS